MSKVSPYCFPIKEERDKYVQTIESIRNDNIRILLKLILCCGFRANEILNSYLYYDIEKNIYIRAPASKTSEFSVFNEMKKKAYTGHSSRFLGRGVLNKILTDKTKWKSVMLENVFNFDLSDFKPFINSDIYTVNQYVAEYLNVKDYNTAYRLLKKGTAFIKVKMKPGKFEATYKTRFNPSFHFYRKLFVSELNTKYNYNFLRTVDYVKWKNLQMILHYVKDY